MTRPFLRHGLAGGLALGLLAALVMPSSPAVARTVETAKVVRVIDGDTLDVDRNGDGRIDARIRLIGIDAPEKGLCNYQAAKDGLARLVKKKRVELRSDTGRIGILGRPERRVLVPVGGQIIDASEWLLERGLGVWMPRKNEQSGTVAEHQAADRAAAAGLGWFNSTRCGPGPFPGALLTMQAEYLADAAHVMTPMQIRNQEFIRIRNDGPEAVSIDGWTLRVGNDRSMRVPAGGPIPPGGAVEIHIGSGANSATDRFLGFNAPLLVNGSIDGGKHLGGGSYLIDPEDDIRAHLTWPCTLNCADPTAGALQLSDVMVDPPGPEWIDLNTEYVTITNRGAGPITLGDYVLEAFPFVYEFPPFKTLQVGESVTVRAGTGQDTTDTRFLGAAVPPLDNAGGRVLLRTYGAAAVDCYRWGSGSCPPVTP